MRIGNRLNWSGRRPDIAQLLPSLFLLSGLWLVISAMQLNRSYQDSWILAGIVAPLGMTTLLYLVNVVLSRDLERVAILTAVFAFLLNAAPALKYYFPYGSTTDVAGHIEMARTIANTHLIDVASAYRNAPGFHSIVALLAESSNLPVWAWTKVIPPMLGALLPLGAYTISRRAFIPFPIAKAFVILSGLCLPTLYELNGTSFAVPLYFVLVIVLLLREMDDATFISGLAYTLLGLVLICTLIVWHPASSVLAPISVLFAGFTLTVVFRRRHGTSSRTRLTSAAVLGVVAVLAYWMFDAAFVWERFASNLNSMFVQPELAQALVPKRLFTINAKDGLLIGLFYHARDGVILGLSIIGLFRIWRQTDVGYSNRKLLHIFSSLWLFWILLIGAIFATGFGGQGYRRFTLYLIGISPLLASYGFCYVNKVIARVFPSTGSQALAFFSFAGITVFCFLQLFPIQPLVPRFINPDSSASTPPVLWFHRVNTADQYYMLDFALHRLPRNKQFVADYIGQRQSSLYWGRQSGSNLRRTINQKLEPSFLLLHWPGEAGAYAEQAEYRSRDAIQGWRDLRGIDAVYDNGGSFILYSSINAQRPFALEGER